MNVIRIPFPSEGNELYPLPADYFALTEEYQRRARVNACRQWLVPHTTPEEKAFAATESVRYFDEYYLHPTDQFDPLFYDNPPLPTPEFHYDLIRLWHTNRMSLSICPRGSGKSNTSYKDIILRLLSRPTYKIVYATSTHDNAKLAGQTVRDQLFDNPRIFDDWSPEPEFSGRIKPTRGDKAMGVEFFYIGNGSWLQVRSAEARQRGLRPHRYRLDDPEYDPKESTSMSILRAGMENLLFRVVLPMVMRAGCGVDWTATFVSRRHYAWHAMQNDGPLAKDPRFSYWARMLVRACQEDPTTKRLISCWPEMWPVDSAERDALQLDPDTRTLEEMRTTMSSAIFNSEYMAKPGDSGTAFFPQLTEEIHGYHLEDIDEYLEDRPRLSSTKLCFHRGEEIIREPLVEWLARARLFITCDYAYTEKADSDFKVACLMGHDPFTNELFVLDLYASQGSKQKLITAAFAMADRWQVPTIYPEVVKESVVLYNEMVDITRTRAQEHLGYTFCPSIIPIKPGMEPKIGKISSLLLRFEHGLIKLPLHRRNDAPWFQLFEQIESFNPDSPDGGLEKDDCIDAVSMSKFVLKGRRFAVTPETPSGDPVDHLLAGKYAHNGVPIGPGVNWACVSRDKITALLAAEQPDEEGGTRV